MHGAVCVGTLAEGTIGGKRVRRFMYQITSHDEAFSEHGVQGTGWQTGVPGRVRRHHARQGARADERASSRPSRSSRRRSSSS